MTTSQVDLPVRSEETEHLIIGGGDSLHAMYPGPPKNNIERVGILDYVEDEENYYRTSGDRDNNFSQGCHDDYSEENSDDT